MKRCGNQSGLCPTHTLLAGFGVFCVSGGKTLAARPAGELQAFQPKCSLERFFKEDFIYVFNVPNVSNVGILITVFTSSCNFKISLEKNILKYLQDIKV